MGLISDDNFEDYLKEAIDYWDGRLATWKQAFDADPDNALVDNDDIFRIIAMREVYTRIARMVDTDVITRKVESIRDYAMSMVLTMTMNPSRTKAGARAVLDSYRKAAWSQVTADLNLPFDSSAASMLGHKPV